MTGRPVVAAGGPGAPTPAVGIALRYGRVLWTAAIPPAVSVVGVCAGRDAGGSGAYGAAVPDSDPSAAAAANPGRFLTLEQVAEDLNVSRSQVYALVRDRSVVAVKIGGRGQWRVERAELERYIAGLYEVARRSPGPGPDGEVLDG